MDPSSSASALSSQFLLDGTEEALVASFDSMLEAQLAHGRLEVEGIAARIFDASPTAVYAPTGHSAGGVKLWVAAENLEAARSVLFAPSALVEPLPEEADEAPPPAPVLAEDLALRAFRASVLGFIVVPPLLHAYSAFLLVRAVSAPGDLSPRARRQVTLALLFDSAAFAAAGVIGWAILS